MKQSDKNLESLAVFPYVAWGVTILFAVFVYDLATNLQDTADRLQAQADALEERANTPAEEIDFTDY